MGGGAGGASGTTTSIPVFYNWEQTLTPWAKSGQPWVIDMLKDRVAGGGMTPKEESSLWGQARSQIETAGNQAGQGLARQLATSGISPNSPAAAGGWSDVMANKVRSSAGAASEFIKTKLGQSNTVMNQLLTSLFTPAPTAVGQISTGTTSQTQGK